MAIHIVFSDNDRIIVTDAARDDVLKALQVQEGTWPDYPHGGGRAWVNPARVAYVYEPPPPDDRPSLPPTASDAGRVGSR